MRKIELQPIREWQEKDGKKLLPSIRIYVGQLHVGTAYRCKRIPEELTDMYSFSGFVDATINISDRRQPLEDIKAAVEESMKQYAGKFLRRFVTLKPVKPAQQKAQP